MSAEGRATAPRAAPPIPEPPRARRVAALGGPRLVRRVPSGAPVCSPRFRVNPTTAKPPPLFPGADTPAASRRTASSGTGCCERRGSGGGSHRVHTHRRAGPQTALSSAAVPTHGEQPRPHSPAVDLRPPERLEKERPRGSARERKHAPRTGPGPGPRPELERAKDAEPACFGEVTASTRTANGLLAADRQPTLAVASHTDNATIADRD